MNEQLAVDAIRGQLRTGFPVRAWLYVGAGTGSFLEAYSADDVPQILALEAENGAYTQLNKSFSRNAARHCRKVLVAPKDGEYVFYEASSSRESGLVAPAELAEVWRNLTERDHYSLYAKSLASILRDEQAQLEVVFNWLTLDCLPAAELLSELHSYADQLDVVEVRAIADEAQVLRKASRRAVVEILEDHGFELRAERQEHHPYVLRLFFVRAWRQLYEAQKRSAKALEDELGVIRDEHHDQVEALIVEQESLVRELAKYKGYGAELAIELDKHKDQGAELAVELAKHKDCSAKLVTELAKYKDQGAELVIELAKHKEHGMELSTELGSTKRQVVDLQGKIAELQAEKERLERKRMDAETATLARLVENIKDDSQKHSKELVAARKAIERAVKLEVSNSTRQIEAFMDIQNYLRYGEHLPLLHGWPISPDFGRLLLDLIDCGEYDLIIEFGSGSSTQLIAQALRGMQRHHSARSVTQIAFEHLDEYHQETRAGLTRAGVNDCVELMLAPLTPYDAADGVTYQYYDFKIVSEILQKYDSNAVKKVFIVVDGPPAATGLHARYPALPLILNQFANRRIDVLLDDYSRQDEKEVVQKWMSDIRKIGIKAESRVFDMEKDACFIKVGLN